MKPASRANALPTPSEADEEASQGGSDEAEGNRPDELVECIRLRELARVDHRRHDRLERGGEEGGADSVNGDDDHQRGEGQDVRQGQGREQADGETPAKVRVSRIRRRSNRSLIAPPRSRQAIVGTVIAIPTTERAAGVFQSE